MPLMNPKVAIFNYENGEKCEGPNIHRNDASVANFLHIKLDKDVHLKSGEKYKVCTLKDLNFNGDYLIKGKRKKEKGDYVIKNKELILPNKHNMDNIQDIYYIYKEDSDICDLIIRRYNDNIYLSIFNNMLIIINPCDYAHTFYKLLFNGKNKNNYIFSSFINYALQKKLGKVYSEFDVHKNSDNNTSDEDYDEVAKNMFRHMEKNICLKKMNIFDFYKLKKKKKLSLIEMKKELYTKSNDEIVKTHKDILHNFKINFNQLFNINTELRRSSTDNSENESISGTVGGILESSARGSTSNYSGDGRRSTSFNSYQSCIKNSRRYQKGNGSHSSIQSSCYNNLIGSKNPELSMSNYGNKLLFIYGEKNSNQNVINTYIFKHIVKKGGNKELYHAYKNIMNVLNLFFNYKCYNFIIYLCNNNKILYFNVIPCFLNDKSNLTNICSKISNFLKHLNGTNASDKKRGVKKSTKKMRKKNSTLSDSECRSSDSRIGKGEEKYSYRYEHRKKKKKKKTKGHRGEEVNAGLHIDTDCNTAGSEEQRNAKEKHCRMGKGNKKNIYNIPYIFFFLLESTLLDSSHKYYKHLKLHPLDIKKIYKNYLDAPTNINIKASDINRTFDYFLELGFTENDIISIIKICYAIIFINIYITIRICLRKNEKETLNFLHLQLINVQDYKNLVMINSMNRKEKNPSDSNYNNHNPPDFLKFDYEKYVSSDFSSYYEEENGINCIGQVIQNEYRDEKKSNMKSMKNVEIYDVLNNHLDKNSINMNNTEINNEEGEGVSSGRKNVVSNGNENQVLHTNRTKNREIKRKQNYFIVFAGHIMEEYISFLLDVDLSLLLNILNNTIKLKNLCSTIFFRLKIRIIKQINEHLRNYYLHGIVTHSLYLYCNTGLSKNISEKSKKEGERNDNSLTELINNMYNEILHSYYLKMSMFNMDSYLIHTINSLNESGTENDNYDSALCHTVEIYRRFSDYINNNEGLKSSYIFKFGRKNTILYLLQKYTSMYLNMVENCNESRVSPRIFVKAEYYKIMFLFYVAVTYILRCSNEKSYTMICDKSRSNSSNCSRNDSDIHGRRDSYVSNVMNYDKNEMGKNEKKLDCEDYAEKMLIRLIENITKSGNMNSCEGRTKNARKKKYFSIVHYNNEKINYRCNNMILDNANDLCAMSDIIQIVEKSKMKFLKNLFFENRFPLKYFKDNFLNDEICFFINVIKNTYEKFYVLLINEREIKKNDNFLYPKYMAKYAKRNDDSLLNYAGERTFRTSSGNSDSSRSNLFKKDFFSPPLSVLNRPVLKSMSKSRRIFSFNSAITKEEEIINFSELKKKINEEHIKSVIDMLNLKAIFSYQLKYLYHNLTCLDFIKKYLLFCIHVSRDRDLIKLVSYYELKHRKRKGHSCFKSFKRTQHAYMDKSYNDGVSAVTRMRNGANGREIDRENERENDTENDRENDREIAKEIDREIAKEIDREIDREIDNEIDNENDNEIGNEITNGRSSLYTSNPIRENETGVGSNKGSAKGNGSYGVDKKDEFNRRKVRTEGNVIREGRLNQEVKDFRMGVVNMERMKNDVKNFNYLNYLTVQEKKDLCEIILKNFNISKNSFYFRDFIFLCKYVYFILENLRAQYVKLIVPYIHKIENSYLSYKNKKLKINFRDKIIVIQNYMRRFLFLQKVKRIEKQKNLLVSFIIFYSYIVKNKDFDKTKETLELCKDNFMKNEKKLIRHAASVYIQSWYRKIIQQRKYKALKMELFQKRAIENINKAIRTYLVQIKIIKNLKDVIIPNRCAILIQSYFRRYICVTNYQKKLFLKICFLSIKRKYFTYSSVVTKVNYHYLIKNIYSRNIIQSQFKIPEAVIKIQCNYKAYVVRKQFTMLMNAIYFTQAYVHTCVERMRYNKMKKSIILIQRWWKNFYKLKNIFSLVPFNMYSSEYDKRRYYFLQKNNFPFYNYYTLKEKKSLKLLTYHILLKQWYFFYFKKFQKKNHQFNIVFNLKLYKNVSYHYTLPWAYKINNLLKIIHMKQMFQKCTNNAQNTIFNIPVFESIQIFVGRTHTILLINQSVINDQIANSPDGYTNSNNMHNNTYGERKNYYSKFVYSLGSNDYGQLGYYSLFEKNFIYHSTIFPKHSDTDFGDIAPEKVDHITNRLGYDMTTHPIDISDEEQIDRNDKCYELFTLGWESNSLNKGSITRGKANTRRLEKIGKRYYSKWNAKKMENTRGSVEGTYRSVKLTLKDEHDDGDEMRISCLERNSGDFKNCKVTDTTCLEKNSVKGQKCGTKNLCNNYKKNIQHLIFEHKRKFTINENLFSNAHEGSLHDVVDYKVVEKRNNRGENEKIVEFTKVVSETNKIVNISCGSEHTLALSENGNVYSWGSNIFGQCSQKYEKNIIRYPRIIKHFLKKNIKIKNISCASYHSAYISRKNDLYISGNFFFINLKYFHENIFEPLFLISGCHTILCNDSYNVCLKVDKSSLYIWGNNYKCVLGLNNNKLRNLDEISHYPLTNISPNICVNKITCSDNFVCIITKPTSTKHSLYMWGQFALIEKKEESPSSFSVTNMNNVFNKFRIKANMHNSKNNNQESENSQSDTTSKKKIIFIAKPSPVYDSLWDNVEPIDVCCDLDEILVLMNNLCLYGFSAVEIISNGDKKGKGNETNFSYSKYGRRELEQRKEKKITYKEPEVYENIKVLSPSLYMFKYFKPSYFNIKKINCSYNRNSLSIMNATMGEYEIPTVAKKLEYVTPAGDIMQFPEKIREAILAKAKRESNKWIRSTDDPYINHFLIKNSSDSDSVN
ncbi:hypothetical protein, conserved [Plasmodium gonderi]|uniref:Cell cycle associated protein n=1 Tax=Plasmodium gonderi TaxID=77519 RepID=A0A1Y1JMV9_PLAGO|nr:hypothetical protein, conserved [Plasmodium gonderi]GAW83580.1 hypothetical protein, conserved [Plasmodium gonderi]